jgi:hypothetical protein
MVRQGDTLILTVAELQEDRQAMIDATIKRLVDNKFIKQDIVRLRLKDIAAKYKIHYSTVQKWTERKKNPLVMTGHPKTAEESYVEEWYKYHSGEYQM